MYSAAYLQRLSQGNLWKKTLWVWGLGLMTLASILGTIVHGFKMSKALQALLWHPLNLTLGLIVSIFLVAVVYDIWGETISRRTLPIMAIISICFFGITLVWPDSFLVFIVYESIIMLFSLGGYIWLTYRHLLKGAWLMTVGVFVTIIASGIQASHAISFDFIWPFGSNGWNCVACGRSTKSADHWR